jgi:hypothetical protein
MTFNGMVLNAVSENGIRDQNLKNGMICILGRCSGENDILRKMAGYTMILTKWELEDDIADGMNLKSNAARIALGRAMRKASRSYPEYDACVGKGFETLRDMETNGCADPVLMGRTFASSLVPAMEDIAGDAWNDDLEDMFISLGTSVYIMDAADDLDEDHMNDTYNPFLTECDDFVNKSDFMNRNVYKMTNIMNSVMRDMQSSYLRVRNAMRFHHGVTDNIIFHGIPGSAKRVIACNCKARPGIMNTISSRILRRNGV